MSSAMAFSPRGIQEDIPGDKGADTRWLSYAELAVELDIKRESVIRLVRRKRWPKREANQAGEVRVAIPADVLADMRQRREAGREAAKHVPEDIPEDDFAVLPDVREEMSRAYSLLEQALADVREDRDKERARADRAETRADRAEAAAEHARRAGELDRASAAEERARASEERGRLQAHVEQLVAELGKLRAKAASNPTAASAPRGLFARLLRRG